MKQEMLINVSQPEECRIAIVEDGVLEELYIERTGQDNYVGNIYKGVVVNLEPSIQAAFVDFGVGRNGFLHISDVEPQYFRQGGYDPDKPHRPHRSRGAAPQRRRIGRRTTRSTSGDEDAAARPRSHRLGGRPRVKPPIQEILRRGDEVLVQVIKEGIGTKGPTLSTYISIPGRYLVLMPALGRVGVSRKIEDDDVRRRLRDIMLELNPPKGLGFIVRTAGTDRTKKELSRDLAYLLRLWKVIVRRIKKTPGAGRHLRRKRHDHPHDPRHLHRATSTRSTSTSRRPTSGPRSSCSWSCRATSTGCSSTRARSRCSTSTSSTRRSPRSTSARCRCKAGGSIVIDQTEALVAIDVNSGNFRADDSAEETAYQMNLLAAKEIARQIRLRDLGGVIVNDFIDMRKERHRRGVERALRDAVKRDRARTKILRTSPFGLIEMTRQRIRPSLKRSVYADCPSCSGTGRGQDGREHGHRGGPAADPGQPAAQISPRSPSRWPTRWPTYLNNRKRRELTRLEDEGKMTVQVLGAEGRFARTPGHRVPRRRRPRSEIPLGLEQLGLRPVDYKVPTARRAAPAEDGQGHTPPVEAGGPGVPNIQQSIAGQADLERAVARTGQPSRYRTDHVRNHPRRWTSI